MNEELSVAGWVRFESSYQVMDTEEAETEVENS